MLDFSKIEYVGHSTGSNRKTNTEPTDPVAILQTTGFKQSRSIWFSKSALTSLGVNLESDERPYFSFWSMNDQMGFVIADENNHVGPSFRLGKVSQKVNCKPAYDVLCKFFNLQTEPILNEGEDTGDSTLVDDVTFSFHFEGENQGRKYYSFQVIGTEAQQQEMYEEQAAEAQMAQMESEGITIGAINNDVPF